MSRTIALRDVFSAASRAADQLVIGRAPVRQGEGVYAVPSAHTDEVYTVRIDDLSSLRATCTCPHGGRLAQGLEANGECWHVVAALMAEATMRPRRPRGAVAANAPGQPALAA